jgi:hypothetical protein
MGSATIPVPLPKVSLGFLTQWVIFDAGANAVGLALSDGRKFSN